MEPVSKSSVNRGRREKNRKEGQTERVIPVTGDVAIEVSARINPAFAGPPEDNSGSLRWAARVEA